MSQVTATIVLTLAADVRVGDTFDIKGHCRVVGIRDDLIDVTPLGGERDYVAGERSFEFLIRDARVVYGPRDARVVYGP